MLNIVLFFNVKRSFRLEKKWWNINLIRQKFEYFACLSSAEYMRIICRILSTLQIQRQYLLFFQLYFLLILYKVKFDCFFLCTVFFQKSFIRINFVNFKSRKISSLKIEKIHKYNLHNSKRFFQLTIKEMMINFLSKLISFDDEFIHGLCH